MPPKAFYKRCSQDGSCDPKLWHSKEGCERDALKGDVCRTQKGGAELNPWITNPWIRHVKKYAAQHGISYSEALKDPNTRASYQSGY